MGTGSKSEGMPPTNLVPNQAMDTLGIPPKSYFYVSPVPKLSPDHRARAFVSYLTISFEYIK